MTSPPSEPFSFDPKIQTEPLKATCAFGPLFDDQPIQGHGEYYEEIQEEAQAFV